MDYYTTRERFTWAIVWVASIPQLLVKRKLGSGAWEWSLGVEPGSGVVVRVALYCP